MLQANEFSDSPPNPTLLFMINQSDQELLTQQLGRSPDGFQEVMKRNLNGEPAVIRVASVVNGVPFPTLFWISDPELSDLIYQHESRGMTQKIQSLIDESTSYQERMRKDNIDHIQLRESYFDRQVREQLSDLGIVESFGKKGVGGNGNFTRVRCLHAWLGSHIIQPNLVGKLHHDFCEPADPLVIALSKLN